MSGPAEEELRAERILVAFDTSPLGHAALEAAAALAAALDAEVAGLFVEDLDLLRMAALPCTRELGLASAVVRALEAPDIERALRLQAQQTRRTLEALAAELNLRWSFEVVRGRVLPVVLERAREPGMVVFGKAAHGSAAGSAWTERAGARFARLAVRPVAVLFDDTRGGRRALAAARSLAARAGARLAVLMPAQTTRDFERLRERARAGLGARGTAHFLRLRSREPEEVARALALERAAVLLWHDGTMAGGESAFRALLRAVACPVVLVT